MSDVKVIASMDGDKIPLDESGGTYSADAVAPLDSVDVSITATDGAGNSTTETLPLEVGNGWLPPKTDWKSTDYFNIEDYNRIVGNLNYLKALGNTLFLEFSLKDMESEKTYSSMMYASEMNLIEDNLESINRCTYGFEIGEKPTFRLNKATPLWSEFNRIESSCLRLYKTMKAHKDALPRLAYRLGGQKGIRV